MRLDVSIDFLKDDTQSVEYTKEELFIMEAKEQYGSKGANEAKKTVDKVKGLMAGGSLDEGSKDAFLRLCRRSILIQKNVLRNMVRRGNL